MPKSLTKDEASATETYTKFIAEPFEAGYGHTVGNSLRRVLLSSLEGAAITSIRITGAQHEFATLTGIVEDVTDIVLNLKKVKFKAVDHEPRLAQASGNVARHWPCGRHRTLSSTWYSFHAHRILCHSRHSSLHLQKKRLTLARLALSGDVPFSGRWASLVPVTSLLLKEGKPWPKSSDVDLLKATWTCSGLSQRPFNTGIHAPLNRRGNPLSRRVPR